MSVRVLLVEDDLALQATLAGAMRLEGYLVECVSGLEEARSLLRARRQVAGAQLPDVILVDLGLPDGDGGELLDAPEPDMRIPIIIISARYDDSSKVRLLDAGADDYLVKPFSVGELLARIRVAMRHRGRGVDSEPGEYRFGGLEISVPRHQVTLNGSRIHLTPTEFKLLARLASQPGQVITHRQLLADVWGPDYVEHVHYLRLYMGQLRAKLEKNPTEPALLLTEPGVGYRLAEGG